MKRMLMAVASGLVGIGLVVPEALASEADCYAIRNQDQRNVCLALKTAQPSYCYAVRSQDTRNFCLAVTTARESYCFSVRNDDSKNMCLALVR